MAMTPVEDRFSTGARGLRFSAIRRMSALIERPGVISFAPGQPSPETFPVEAFQEIVREIIARDSAAAFQYILTRGVGGLLYRELPPKRSPYLIDVPSREETVGPREVDVFENTVGVLGISERLERFYSVVVDDDYLARLYLPHVLGLDKIERAGLGREYD